MGVEGAVRKIKNGCGLTGLNGMVLLGDRSVFLKSRMNFGVFNKVSQFGLFSFQFDLCFPMKNVIQEAESIV